MTVSSSHVTVSTSATALSTATYNVAMDIILQAPSSNSASVWLGGSDVSTSNGLELAPGASLSVKSNGNSVWYGRVAASTEAVYVATQPSVGR